MKMTTRISRHRAERPSHWRTIEEPFQIDEALGQADGARTVVVDCLNHVRFQLACAPRR